MASARYAVRWEARIRANAELEERGPIEVFAPLRDDKHVKAVRWLSGGTPSILQDALNRTLRDVVASRDAAAGLAAVHLVQALVLAALDGERPDPDEEQVAPARPGDAGPASDRPGRQPTSGHTCTLPSAEPNPQARA